MWRKILLLVILWLLTISPAEADTGPFYFPILSRFIHPCYEVATVSDWKVIAPTSTTNYVLNPSGEIAGNFAALAGTTVTRDSAFQHYGLYSYRVQSNADNEGMTLTLEALTNVAHWITLRVRGTLPAAWDVSLDNATYTEPTLLEAIDTEWSLYGVELPAAQANTSVMLWIRQKGAGSGDFYVDGVQVEPTTFTTWTTYCDGTQEGCEWNGTPHASSSTRSPDSRAGGIVYDLEDDYGFLISGMSGTGTAPQELFIDSYSQLPGGELNARKVGSRVITLTGVITGTDEADFYQKKQTLESLFDPEGVPEDENGEQPVRLRFVGAAVHKEIKVFYETGLEANITADDPCAWEQVAIRFIADDPYWYEIGESAALLDTNDSATFETVAARLRSTGQWSNLGPPNPAGGYSNIQTIIEDSVYVYLGGAYTNFDNIAAADGMVRRNKQTGVYSAMGTGLASGTVPTPSAMVLAPNGNLYVGGSNITSFGGVANTANLAMWDGAAWNSITPSGSPNGAVFALALSPTGLLYAAGSFTSINGVAANRVAVYDGSTWSALGSGLAGSGFALAINNQTGLVYIGHADPALGYISTWDGSSLVEIGNNELDNAVRALVISQSGLVYIGGQFTGGAAVWNGSIIQILGSGVNNTVFSLALGPDGILLLSGAFTQAGDITLADRIARWNGYTYSHLDIDLPGAAQAFAIYPSKYVDPVIPQKYDLYLGFNTSGTGLYAGLETVSNGGTAPAFPKIFFNRSGGTTAIIQTLRNERTGKELLFNYSLQNGETLTIDLDSPEKSITSSTGSPAQGAVLANSALGDWSLSTGNNDVTSFVSTSGSPTVTAWMVWRDRYKSQN